MSREISDMAMAGSSSGTQLFPLQAVIRVPPVVPQHKNPRAVRGFTEEQVVRERPEVGPPQRRAGDAMESLWILLEGGNQALKLVVQTSRELRSGHVVVITQGASKVFLEKPMEGQSHLGATTASLRASIRPASSLLLGPDPSQHPGEGPRRRHHRHRREPLAASSAGARLGKPGCSQGVSSPPAQDRLMFPYSKIISCRRFSKRFWFLGGVQLPPCGQPNFPGIWPVSGLWKRPRKGGERK